MLTAAHLNGIARVRKGRIAHAARYPRPKLYERTRPCLNFQTVGTVTFSNLAQRSRGHVELLFKAAANHSAWGTLAEFAREEAILHMSVAEREMHELEICGSAALSRRLQAVGVCLLLPL